MQKNRTTMAPVHMLTLAEAVSEYGISARRLAKWRNNGLPCLIGSGRRLLIRRKILEQWIATYVAEEKGLSQKRNASRYNRQPQ